MIDLKKPKKRIRLKLLSFPSSLSSLSFEKYLVLPFFLSLIVLFMNSIPLAESLSIYPADKVIYLSEYEDDLNHSISVFFHIEDNTQYNNRVDISFPEQFSSFILLERDAVSFSSNEDKKSLLFEITPQGIEYFKRNPGINTIPFSFTQTILEDKSGFSAKLNVIANLRIVSPFSEYFVNFSYSLKDKTLNLFLLNQGLELKNCSFVTKIYKIDESEGKNLFLEKQESIDLLKNQISFSYIINSSGSYEFNSSLSCENYENNWNQNFVVLEFPYDINLENYVLNKDVLDLEFSMRNPNNEPITQKELFFEIYYQTMNNQDILLFKDSRIIRRIPMYGSETLKIIFPIDPRLHEQISENENREIRVVFSVKDYDEVVTFEQRYLLKTEQTINRFILVIFLFIIITISVFIISKKEKFIKNDQ